MSDKKVLILYNRLFHYRIPIWNIIAKQFNLTLIYSYPAKEEDIKKCEFKTRYAPIKQYGKFILHQENIYDIAKEYDVVVCYEQLSYLKYSQLAFRKRNFNLVYWTLGAPASYNRKFGEASKLYYLLDDAITKRGDAVVVYTRTAKRLYEERGFKPESVFVANNTVKVIQKEHNSSNKNKLLFIGTLYLEKGLQILLDVYKEAYSENKNILPLEIVGGGTQFDQIKEWITNHGLHNQITMLGPIYEVEEKAKIFKTAIACLSPLQAGLSVLESMGYGVPFITSEDAITGGEAFNIENGVNGLRIKDISKFKETILDISTNKQKYLDMGVKAYEHYWTKCTPENMAQGVIDAIKYSIKKNKENVN